MDQNDYDLLRDALNFYFATNKVKKKDFVNIIKCDPTGFSKYINGKRPSMDEYAAYKAIKYLRGKILHPLPSIPDIEFSDSNNISGIEESRYIEIPVLAACASMGGGSFETSKKVASHVSFHEEFLVKKSRNIKKLCFILTYGDSMSPTIAENALVLIDFGQTEPIHNKVYYVRHNQQEFVKRIEVRNNSVTALISDKDCSRIEIGPEDDFAIHGRVILQQSEI